MDFEELNDFVDWEAKRHESLFNKSNSELVLPSAVKLSEEVGELMSEVLKHSSMQRTQKMESKEVILQKISNEFADVIITASVLAKRLGVDIDSAVEDKIEIIRGRKY